jgi:hypothetical protein
MNSNVEERFNRQNELLEQAGQKIMDLESKMKNLTEAVLQQNKIEVSRLLHNLLHSAINFFTTLPTWLYVGGITILIIFVIVYGVPLFNSFRSSKDTSVNREVIIIQQPNESSINTLDNKNEKSTTSVEISRNLRLFINKFNELLKILIKQLEDKILQYKSKK